MKKRFLSAMMAAVLVMTMAGYTANAETSAQGETNVQQVTKNENGDLIAVTTAGGYEINLSDLAHQTGSDDDPVVYYNLCD